MKTTIVCGGALFLFLCAVGVNAEASPIGTTYSALLDADVIDLASGETAFEGHLGEVIFDSLPELIPNDIDPSVDVGPPFLPGNDLIVSESLATNPDGSETVSIWFEAQDPTLPFPTSGAPLFVNRLAEFGLAIGGVFDDLGGGSGLVWGADTPVTVSDVSVSISFPLGATDAIPLDMFIEGDGTLAAPLFVAVELDPGDFYSPAGDFDGVMATGFHLSFTVSHVPEPATVAIAALGLLAVIVPLRRRAAS